LWDIAGIVFHATTSISLNHIISHLLGQERYGNMTRIYYQGANAALVVFDVTRYVFTTFVNYESQYY
jgi:GTPase SAR1 family protein